MTQHNLSLTNDNIASISSAILEQMGLLRKKFKPFIKWHEAYAYIKKEIIGFEWTPAEETWTGYPGLTDKVIK